MTAGVCFAYVYCYRFGFLQMEFQICLHFCVSFFGEKKAVERSGRTNLQSRTYYNHRWGIFSLSLSSPPSCPLCPLFVCCGFICLASKLEATGPCRCSNKVTYLLSQTDVHSTPFHQHFVIQGEQTCGNRLEQHKGWDIKESCREPDRFQVFKKGMWVEGEKCAEQNFMGVFSGLFEDYYVLDTVNHLYTHVQEVNL